MILLPNDVRYSDSISSTAKIFYYEILIQIKKNGSCEFDNNYFADRFKVSKQSASRVINQLKKNNFIETKIIVDKQTKQVKKRIIKIKDTIHKNDDRGIYKNDKVYIYNNNNNINNNKYEKIKINFKDYPKEVQGLFLSLEKIFQSKFLPKTKKQKKEWVKAIDDLWRLDDYHPRKVYIILDKVSKDDFWNKNCNTILKLRRTNKDKIKYIDYFDSIFANHLKNKNFDKYPDKRRST
jgi:hypothetical protein